jgi:hypothetical protein
MDCLRKGFQIGMGSTLVVVIGHVINGLKDGGDGDGVPLRPGILLSPSRGDRPDVRLAVLNSVRTRFDRGACLSAVCSG